MILPENYGRMRELRESNKTTRNGNVIFYISPFAMSLQGAAAKMRKK
jgi:hypothetical protein